MRVEPIKELKKILATLVMLSIIFSALIMPAQSEQSDVVKTPTANFFAFSTSGAAPFDAAFMDSSTGNPTEWCWEFGDGATSTKQDPDHTYSEPGSYTVKLTVTNDAGSDEKTKAGYINVEESTKDTEKPVAGFDAYVTSGTAPFNVVFLDESKGEPTSWDWDFGDGATSTQRDPEHTYSEPGSYTVKLTATNDAGSDEKTKYDYITVEGPTTNTESKTDVEPTRDMESTKTTAEKPVAKFSATPKSGIRPLTVKFTDKSTRNPTEWYWDFGDGETSYEQNPTHTYSELGTYKAKLIVNNEVGESKKTVTVYVKAPKKPVAKFSATPKSGTGPLSVKFTDKSKGNPTDWYWDFGDGSTSDSANPVHEYSQAGTYTVSLTVANDVDSGKVTKTGYIKVKESTKDTQTSASKSVSLSYLQLAATSDPARPQGETTPGAVDSVKIVEAALAEAGYLDETYAYDGSYGTTTVQAYKNWQKDLGSSSKYCDGIPGKKDLTKLGNKYGFTVDTSTVSNSKSEPEKDTTKLDVPAAEFSASSKSGDTPLTVTFTDKSTGTPTSWKWTFGDGKTSTDKNPTHKYSEAGEYTVTLKAANDAGSNKTTKSKYIKVKDKVDISAKAYPEPGLSVFSASLNKSGKTIDVVYDLDSDFYSDSSTRTYFSIGYKFHNEQMSRAFKDQFVNINERKGRHVAQIPYPGAKFPAKVTIYTHYKIGDGNSPLGGGIEYYTQKLPMFAAPIGVSNHTVTDDDVLAQQLIIAAGEINLLLIPGSVVAKISTGKSLLDMGLRASAAFGYYEAFPDLSKDQYVETTTWCKNDRMYANIQIWQNKKSHDREIEPMYNSTGLVYIY